MTNAMAIVEDLKLILGGSVVHLELTDEEFLRLVKMAFDMAQPYLGKTKYVTKVAAPVIDLTKDNITEVLRVWRGDSIMTRDGNELLFDFQKFRRVRGITELTERQLVNRYAIDDIYIPFEFINGKLYISEGIATGRLTIEGVGEMSIDELSKTERPYNWVFRMAKCLAKEAIARIRGKFTSQNLPVQLDADKLLQEAATEKTELMTELQQGGWGTIFVLR